MIKINFPVILAALICSSTACSQQNAKDENVRQQPNVLFICVDDLRPELGCYGKGYIKSPNIDQLASSGVVFTNHFVSIPTCGASRCSILTGMYPRAQGHLSNEAIRNFISKEPETEVTEAFIHHLKRNGYYTVGIGKTSHYADGLLYGYTDPVGTETAEVSGNVARLRGNLVKKGDMASVKVGFEYRPYAGFVENLYNTDWEKSALIEMSEEKEFSIDIDNLKPGKHDEYRAVVVYPQMSI